MHEGEVEQPVPRLLAEKSKKSSDSIPFEPAAWGQAAPPPSESHDLGLFHERRVDRDAEAGAGGHAHAAVFAFER